MPLLSTINIRDTNKKSYLFLNFGGILSSHFLCSQTTCRKEQTITSTKFHKMFIELLRYVMDNRFLRVIIGFLQ